MARSVRTARRPRNTRRWCPRGTTACTLTQRANGTFTVKVHRQPIGEPGYAYLYRSRPFRTAEALLDALKRAEGESAYQSFEQDLDAMLDVVAELDVKLAMQALRLLAHTPWSKWDPDTDTRVLPAFQLD